MSTTGWIRIGIFLIVLGVSALGAYQNREEIKDKIKSQNVAGAAPTVAPFGGTKSVFDLRVGDCFVDSSLTGAGDETVDLEKVSVVPCIGNWTFKVLKLYAVSGSGAYPGDDFFASEADKNCPLEYDVLIFPTKESWSRGDRAITCLDQR
jgi:hypothetical protein